MDVNLADPDFEPTDEQLRELMKQAFTGVRERHLQALTRLDEETAQERVRALERLKAPPKGP